MTGCCRGLVFSQETLTQILLSAHSLRGRSTEMGAWVCWMGIAALAVPGIKAQKFGWGSLAKTAVGAMRVPA